MGLVGLDNDILVQKVGIFDQVKIVVADVDIQIFAPIILDPFIDDLVTGVDHLDPIGATA